MTLDESVAAAVVVGIGNTNLLGCGVLFFLSIKKFSIKKKMSNKKKRFFSVLVSCSEKWNSSYKKNSLGFLSFLITNNKGGL